MDKLKHSPEYLFSGGIVCTKNKPKEFWIACGFLFVTLEDALFYIDQRGYDMKPMHVREVIGE